MPGLLSRLQVTLLYGRDLSPSVASVECDAQARSEGHAGSVRTRVDRYRAACDVRTLSEEAVEALRQVCPVDAQTMRRRLRRGDRCYVARVGGRAVHFTWVQTGGWHYNLSAGLWHRVRKGEAWVYHGHTAAACRGRGIGHFVVTRIIEDLLQDGTFRSAVVYTTQENRSSQRTIGRAGFSPKGRQFALRVRGLYIPLPGLTTLLSGRGVLEYILSLPEAVRELLRRFGMERVPGRPADLWY